MQIIKIEARQETFTMKRVAAYARVSAGKDAMLHSLAAQVSYYSRLIQENPEWIYCGVYADEAWTGTKANRPEFQRLMADCRAGKIDLVIVKSISRFARNTLDLLNAVRELKRLEIDVFFEEQNIHSLSPDGEFILTIIGAYSQEESRSVSENLRWRYRKAFERGEVINLGFIYGYHQENSQVSINEAEASVVRWIFDAYIGGMSTKEIAGKLDAAGVPTRRGNKWNRTVIQQMLHNEKYTGNSILQKTCRPDHMTKKLYINRGQWERWYVESTHPAILSMAVFNAAQHVLEENRGKNNARVDQPRSSYIFQKMIVCPNCGKYYTRKKTKKSVVWVCGTYLTQGKGQCDSERIPEEILKESIAGILGGLDQEAMRESIRAIKPEKGHLLTIEMTDGTQIQRGWEDRSRADSWTAEMKAKAAEDARKRWNR